MLLFQKNKAPKVAIDKNLLNFDLCYMGNRNAQTFQLTNYLPLNISFQVYIFYLTKKNFL